MEQRRICWPNPDAVCLQGGCLYCDYYPFRDVDTIRRYADRRGLLKDFLWGQEWGWPNIAKRTVKATQT